MNLWFRMIWLFLTASWRGSLTLPEAVSVLNLRVWPTDLDISLHMNNGRYLTLMDLGRTDLILRSGLWRHVMDNKWTPIASAVTIRFRRELRPFQKFRLETRMLCWDATLAIIEQTFVIDGGARDGQVAARALFKGGIYDRRNKTFVPFARLMDCVGITAASPLPSAEVETFLHADDQLKRTDTGAAN